MFSISAASWLSWSRGQTSHTPWARGPLRASALFPRTSDSSSGHARVCPPQLLTATITGAGELARPGASLHLGCQPGPLQAEPLWGGTFCALRTTQECQGPLVEAPCSQPSDALRSPGAFTTSRAVRCPMPASAEAYRSAWHGTPLTSQTSSLPFPFQHSHLLSLPPSLIGKPPGCRHVEAWACSWVQCTSSVAKFCLLLILESWGLKEKKSRYQ